MKRILIALILLKSFLVYAMENRDENEDNNFLARMACVNVNHHASKDEIWRFMDESVDAAYQEESIFDQLQKQLCNGASFIAFDAIEKDISKKKKKESAKSYYKCCRKCKAYTTLFKHVKKFHLHDHKFICEKCLHVSEKNVPFIYHLTQHNFFYLCACKALFKHKKLFAEHKKNVQEVENLLNQERLEKQSRLCVRAHWSFVTQGKLLHRIFMRITLLQPLKENFLIVHFV